MVISEVLTIDVLLFVILIVLFLYYHGVKTFNHFEKLGIKCIKPVPYFGNTMQSTFNRKQIMLCHKDVYDQAKGEDFIGFFQNRNPLLMIRKPQLIQNILIKDFSNFYNRGRNIDERLDPLRAFNLVNLSGQRWKSLRQKLTPAFSSGKLKMMFRQFNECGVELLNYLRTMAGNNKPVDTGEAVLKFTTDVIGTVAFGLQFNSLRDPDSEFRKIGRGLVTINFGQKIRMFLDAIHKKLPTLLNISTFEKKYDDFFVNFVKNTMNFRKENKIERNDFIQILMNLVEQESTLKAKNNDENSKVLEKSNGIDHETTGKKSDSHIVLDDLVLAANTFVFFIAGFETTASTLRNCLFELSLTHNLNIQNRLRDEIQATIKKHNNEITDATIKDMSYMDCVVSETLRKYPVAGILVRICTRPYTIPGTSLVLRKGEKILIPVYSLHHDPEYYPEPDSFDPERFSEENKKNRPNFTYLPFGDGPRACIGSRFALLEVKTALAKIVSQFEVRFNDKTQLPMKWDPYKLLLSPVQQVFLNFNPLKETPFQQ